MDNISGYCKCGCGQKTSISPRRRNSCGHEKNKPVDFIRGHHQKMERHWKWNGGKRTVKGGYLQTYIKDHPSSDKNGYVLDHVLVVEKALGKILNKNVVIHHIDNNKKNNNSDNLIVCQSHAYHVLIHKRTRAYKACGNPNWQLCRFCRKYDDPQNMYLNKGGWPGFP